MPIGALFTKAKALVTTAVTPEVTPGCILPDAPPEACNACEACPSLEYPRSFQKIGIDDTTPLWNGPSGWDVHMVVATGVTDWIRDVEEIDGSLMQSLSKVGDKEKGGRKLSIAASNMPVPEDHHSAEDDKPTRVLILPAFKIVDGVKPSMASELAKVYCGSENAITTTTPLHPVEESKTEVEKEGEASAVPPKAVEEEEKEAHKDLPDLAALSISNGLPPPKDCPHDYIILLCSHKRRDARCGISAPILKKEFEKHLRPLGLYRDHSDERPGGVGIYFINHVGGHKFSANVFVYSRKFCVWYARITPALCKPIVDYTILQEKVIDRNLIRAGFNRETGVTSW